MLLPWLEINNKRRKHTSKTCLLRETRWCRLIRMFKRHLLFWRMVLTRITSSEFPEYSHRQVIRHIESSTADRRLCSQVFVSIRYSTLSSTLKSSAKPNYSSRLEKVKGSVHEEFDVWTGPKVKYPWFVSIHISNDLLLIVKRVVLILRAIVIWRNNAKKVSWLT